jgi:hypothetical protein
MAAAASFAAGMRPRCTISATTSAALPAACGIQQ